MKLYRHILQFFDGTLMDAVDPEIYLFIFLIKITKFVDV